MHADSLSHVAFGSGHEGRQLHSVVARTHLHQDFLEGVELTALGVDIVLVHLYIKQSHHIMLVHLYIKHSHTHCAGTPGYQLSHHTVLVHLHINTHTTVCWYTCISTVTPQCAGTPAYQQSHHSVLVHLRINSHTTFCCYT